MDANIYFKSRSRINNVVGLLHSGCTMASPDESLVLAIINDIICSALASSELDGVGRWRHVR